MEQDWEKLLDKALEKKRSRAKAVKFSEFSPEGEAPAEEPASGPAQDEPAGGGTDEIERAVKELRRRVEELTEENRRLREGLAAAGTDDEAGRLRKELADAHAVIRSIEQAYRIGRGRSRR